MMGSVNGSIILLSSESFHLGARRCKNRVRQSFDWVCCVPSSFVSSPSHSLLVILRVFVWRRKVVCCV